MLGVSARLQWLPWGMTAGRKIKFMDILVGFFLAIGFFISFGIFLFGLVGAFEHINEGDSKLVSFAIASVFSVPALYFCVRFVNWANDHPLAFVERGM